MQVIIIFLITILFILDILIISCSVFSNAICIFVTKFISGNRIYSSEGMHALLCMLLVLMRPWRILCYKCIAAFWKRSFLKLSCFRPISELYEFPHCFGKIKLMCPLYWFGKSYIFFPCSRDGDAHIGPYKQFSLGTDCNSIHQLMFLHTGLCFFSLLTWIQRLYSPNWP